MARSRSAMVIYQVCPRSFKDSNGDGLGDLPGIAAELPYVAGLGVDCLWITPFFPSPMADFGYDVADYTGVDPSFGTLADFDALVERTHRLGLKVMIDQVWGHSSASHPWFAAARADRSARTADWYVWADPKPDGTPPNNWLSVFGGPAWTWEPRRHQYYLHHFLPSQPAFDWRHPDLADALFTAGDFWTARGVDGFRLDAVDFLLHDPSLADNPARTVATPTVKPFAMQRHRFDMSHADLPALLERFRARFPATTLMAELSSEGNPLARAGSFTADGRLDLAYTLGLMKRPCSAAALNAFISEAASGGGGFTWAFSNHDVVRVASRWGDGSPAAAKLFLALLLCLPGSLCLYQGEELGLPEADIAFEQMRDPYGIAFFPVAKGRDGCRTPMPWKADEREAGFTTGTPWLPIPASHRAVAVDRQEKEETSPLAQARALLRRRRASAALVKGGLVPIDAGAHLVAFRRTAPGESLLCVFNPSPGAAVSPDGAIRLPPWGYAIGA